MKNLLIVSKGSVSKYLLLKLRNETLLTIPVCLFTKSSVFNYSDLVKDLVTEESLMQALPEGFEIEFAEEKTNFKLISMILSPFYKVMFVVDTIICAQAAVFFGHYVMLPLYVGVFFVHRNICDGFWFSKCKEQIYIKQYNETDYFQELLSTIDMVSNITRTMSLIKDPIVFYKGSAFVYKDDILLCELPLKHLKNSLPETGDISISDTHLYSKKQILEELSKLDINYPKGFSVDFLGLRTVV